MRSALLFCLRPCRKTGVRFSGTCATSSAAPFFAQSYGPLYGAIKLRNAAATAGSGRRIGGKT